MISKPTTSNKENPPLEHIHSGLVSGMPQKDSSGDFGDLTEKNLKQLKILNSVIFPVKYNDKFYTDLLIPGKEDLTKLVYYCDILVGAVCCRVEAKPAAAGEQPSKNRLYIMTLGVLAPYRKLGLGTKLLDYVLLYCSKRSDIEDVYLHVQVNNDQAISFYKRFGFEIIDTIENYYKRIEPPDCYVLQKSLKEKSK